MNDRHTTFDAQPDPRLGAALRAALEPGDSAAFAVSVLARVARARASAWEVLAAWAGRGIVAAAVAALVVGLLAGPALSRAGSWDEAVAAAADANGSLPPTSLLTAAQPPEPAALFASLVE